MRLLYCVQRYGPEVGGGAEAACRMFAERMAARRHHVEVVTSCAVDYHSWADSYAPGTSELNGVVVHRLPVRAERTTAQFGPVSSRVLVPPRAALAVERDWVRVQGPDLPDLVPWMTRNAGRFDVAAFYTYLYPTTAVGLPAAAPRTATVLHPAAHDEPMLELAVFDELFRRADAICLHTPEEMDTIRRRFRFEPLASVVGLGIDVNPPPGDGSRFRARFGLGDDPILLYNGRIEPGKATDELVRYFVRFRQSWPGPVKLVLVGPPVVPVDEHPDVVVTGFVDEQTRLDAYASALAFVMPSYFESFSIALCDAWAIRCPALVNAHCAVLAGQARRSGAGIAYRNAAEFDAALGRLLVDREMRVRMGERGRDYVLATSTWGQVEERYEHLLHRAIEHRRRGRHR
ncbi:MAG: glycosyltransferase family 4 protein [Actinobacteria bacterium]|nr:glycosyltransferase family 4 protein [Actinomycetota bacterium]